MIQNIWAVGRNYVEHAKELGNSVPTEPMIFLKAGSSVVKNGATFKLPSFSSDIHHEVEIAYRFNDEFRFDEMTIALDLTAREVQSKLKAAGHPWTLAKSFKDSCPIGPFVKSSLEKLSFSLEVNGEIRQSGQTSDMIHSAEQLRLYVLERFPVVPGDLLLTGTPKGVSLLRSGDTLKASIDGHITASWKIAP